MKRVNAVVVVLVAAVAVAVAAFDAQALVL
jgi:hypothetical protein